MSTHLTLTTRWCRAGFVLALFVLFTVSACARSPQKVKIPLGATKSVAGGRANVWFGQPYDEWREDLQTVVMGAMVEVRCDADQREVVVFSDKPTEEICGVRLQLLDLKEEGPTFIVLEVTWTD